MDPEENDDERLLEDKEAPEGEADQIDGGEGGDDEEIVVTIGDEPEPEDASGLIRKLRAELKERDRRIAEAYKTPKPVELGPKPTLETCEYDEDRFEEELVKWRETKAEIDRRAKAGEEAQESAQAQLEADRRNYHAAKAKLPPSANMDDAELAVTTTLPPALQGAILRYAKRPEMVILALGKSPSKLNELADLGDKDPVRFVLAVADIERNLKVVSNRRAPSPEKIERGGTVRGGTDKRLAELEKQAEKTGNRTELIEYRKKLKAKAA